MVGILSISANIERNVHRKESKTMFGEKNDKMINVSMEKKDVVISIICLVLLGLEFLIGVGLGINLFFE